MKRLAIICLTILVSSCHKEHNDVVTATLPTPVVPTSIYPKSDTFFGRYWSHDVRRVYGNVHVYDTTFEDILIMKRTSIDSGSIQIGYRNSTSYSPDQYLPFKLSLPVMTITSKTVSIIESARLVGDSIIKTGFFFNGDSEYTDNDTVIFAGSHHH
jgi:hypothetical protein